MSPARASGRWRVLVAFVLAALVTQLLWLNFAPLLVDIERTFHVSDDVASLLVLPFPLLYVVLSLPAGAWIDRKSYRTVVGIGTIVTALGACIRIDSDHFASLVAGQIVIAIAQPFVVNGISKLVADWFEEDEAAIATGLGTVGMFLGMAIGLALTPVLVVQLGMRAAMIANAAFAIVVAVLWFVLCKERGVAQPEHPSSWGALLRNRKLVLLAVLGLLGLGYFNGLTTWLEQLLEPRGLDAQRAGAVGGVIIVGGIVGAIIIPLLADKLRARRVPLIACAVAATACSVWLAWASGFTMTLVSSAALGFFFMPAFALLLTMTGEVVAKQDNGAATAVVMLAGNGGGVAVIVLLGAFGGWASMGPWIALSVVAALTAACAFAAPETARR